MGADNILSLEVGAWCSEGGAFVLCSTCSAQHVEGKHRASSRPSRQASRQRTRRPRRDSRRPRP